MLRQAELPCDQLVLGGLRALEGRRRIGEPGARVGHRRPEHELVEVVPDVVVVSNDGCITFLRVPASPRAGLLRWRGEGRAEGTRGAGRRDGPRREAEREATVERDGVAEHLEGLEDVAVEVEIAGHVRAREPELVRRPQQPTQGITGPDPEDPRGLDRADRAPVPQLDPKGEPRAEHAGQEGLERLGGGALVPVDVDGDVVGRARGSTTITGGKGHFVTSEGSSPVPTGEARRDLARRVRASRSRRAPRRVHGPPTS